ncbi:MAG: glycine--tRNA ligase [Candidatus Nanohaloarchaea archaeon]
MRLGEKVTELSKRRGFYFHTSGAYGGVGGFQTFGPEGAELKRNIEDSWRDKFSRELGNREIEAPTIMQEDVFRASGHLETFDDMIIECPECGESIRADHLVEDNTGIEEAESLSTERIEELISGHDIKCGSCGNELSEIEVEDFNLMFETSIGPGDSQPGYLRPETAQGIFVEFPQLKEYERNQLPFGITQIGKAYRNEISPRKGLVRVRELTQAELEKFIDPVEDEPPLEEVDDVELKLYPRERQGEGEQDYLRLTVREAVEEEVVESEWIAYYLAHAKLWFESIGVDMERFRFRQHLEDELSHYSTDCWDAESQVDGDWIEIAGFSYRGCYDLSKHEKYSQDDFKVFKEYEEPRVEKRAKVDPDMGWLGPTYGDHASEISEELERMVEEEPEVFERNEELRLEIDGKMFEVPVEKTGFKIEEVKKNGEHILPHVAEPSFGIDRAVYTVLGHAYDEDEVDGEERKVLRMSNDVVPTQVAVFPLMDKPELSEKAREVEQKLRNAGFSVKYDESGSIGKRYRRQDEIGTPFCITVDYETLEEEPETVTVRYRDSTEQERIDISKLKEYLE